MEGRSFCIWRDGPFVSVPCLPVPSKRTSDPFRQDVLLFFSVQTHARAFSVNFYIFILFFANQSYPGSDDGHRFFNAV